MKKTTGKDGWLTLEALEYSRPVNMWSLQIEACAYVRHPFYHGVIVIVVALL